MLQDHCSRQIRAVGLKAGVCYIRYTTYHWTQVSNVSLNLPLPGLQPIWPPVCSTPSWRSPSRHNSERKNSLQPVKNPQPCTIMFNCMDRWPHTNEKSFTPEPFSPHQCWTALRSAVQCKLVSGEPQVLGHLPGLRRRAGQRCWTGGPLQ